MKDFYLSCGECDFEAAGCKRGMHKSIYMQSKHCILRVYFNTN